MTIDTPAWRPTVLTPHQHTTLLVVAELLIPRTDSPSARDAHVDRVIDAQLARVSADIRQELLASLAWVDDVSRSRDSVAFLELPLSRQLAVLRSLDEPGASGPGFMHLMQIKMWVARAYYGTDVGMRELGWMSPVVESLGDA
jgi:hypothetical protein